jgi:hypothetical protein
VVPGNTPAWLAFDYVLKNPSGPTSTGAFQRDKEKDGAKYNRNRRARLQDPVHDWRMG